MGEHGVVRTGKHGVLSIGGDGVCRMGERGVLRMGKHEKPGDHDGRWCADRSRSFRLPK